MVTADSYHNTNVNLYGRLVSRKESVRYTGFFEFALQRHCICYVIPPMSEMQGATKARRMIIYKCEGDARGRMV